ncbi:hypothetical protein [Roseivirga pacifica]|uniref:hypothetical protein n=1 Tax=Roseivirga pacifica TaxID=1267423 RepID=UPI003BAF2F36
MKSNLKGSYFVLELEKADLYFLKSDVLEKVEVELKNESLSKRRKALIYAYQEVGQTSFEQLSFPIKLSANNNDLVSNSHLLVYLTYFDLLKEGNVLVYNKSKGKFSERIRYRNEKSKFGQKGVAFYFDSGLEFYYHSISL